MSALATITVGSLAEQAGVDIATILYCERLGLIDKPRRTVGGLKYRTEDVARLTFIRRTRSWASTEAIREQLGMNGDGLTCSNVHDIAERHLLDIRRRMADLARLESVLAPLVSACPQTGRATQCPIVNALSHPT